MSSQQAARRSSAPVDARNGLGVAARVRARLRRRTEESSRAALDEQRWDRDSHPLAADAAAGSFRRAPFVHDSPGRSVPGDRRSLGRRRPQRAGTASGSADLHVRVPSARRPPQVHSSPSAAACCSRFTTARRGRFERVAVSSSSAEDRASADRPRAELALSGSRSEGHRRRRQPGDGGPGSAAGIRGALRRRRTRRSRTAVERMFAEAAAAQGGLDSVFVTVGGAKLGPARRRWTSTPGRPRSISGLARTPT